MREEFYEVVGEENVLYELLGGYKIVTIGNITVMHKKKCTLIIKKDGKIKVGICGPGDMVRHIVSVLQKQLSLNQIPKEGI